MQDSLKHSNENVFSDFDIPGSLDDDFINWSRKAANALSIIELPTRTSH
jgi:hypothetical protein